MSLEPTRDWLLFRAFPPARACLSPAWLSLLGIPWGRRSGRAWASTWGPLPVWSLLLLPGPLLFLSYPYLGLLPWVNEPRVGPAHPSRQPLAPAASGMLQPPSFSSAALAPCLPQPILPGGPSAWSHPTRTQSLTVYNSRWRFYIYSRVGNPHFTQNHLIQPCPFLTPTKGFQTLVVSWGSGIGSWIVLAAVTIPTSSYCGEYTFFICIFCFVLFF